MYGPLLGERRSVSVVCFHILCLPLRPSSDTLSLPVRSVWELR